MPNEANYSSAHENHRGEGEGKREEGRREKTWNSQLKMGVYDGGSFVRRER